MSDKKRQSYELIGLFRLLGPLSHIEGSSGTYTRLVRIPVAQLTPDTGMPTGEFFDVPAYQGNAWKGQLRDLMAEHLLEYLGMEASKEAFHFLFSGGSIGGEHKTDITQARKLRAMLPMVELLGGGVGNQILPGQWRVDNVFPLCAEALAVLPRSLHEAAAAVCADDITHLRSWSRKDDSKDENKRRLLVSDPTAANRAALEDRGLIKKKAKKADADGEPEKEQATQMRFTSELISPGTVMFTRLTLNSVTEEALGCLVTALERFAKSPYIGGQSVKGCGRASLDYAIRNLETGEESAFFSVRDSDTALNLFNLPAEFDPQQTEIVPRVRLSAQATAAKTAYADHLGRLYEALLTDQGSDIKMLLVS